MVETITQRRKIKERWGKVFILPTCIILFVFVVYPIGYTLVLSLCNYNFAFDTGLKFIGFQNFINMFKDPKYLKAFGNSMFFTLIMFTILVVFSLILALLLFGKKKHSWFFRTAIFMPIVVPASLICILFSFMLADNFGVINRFLIAIGLPSWTRNWLTEAPTARLWVMLVSVWGKVGFCAILFLSGLQSIPNDLYEAADIDGAIGLKKLIYIILPSLTETFVVVGIWSVLQCLKLFVTPNVLTHGGPANETKVLYQYIYETAFENFKMGYAAAQALVLTLIVMFFSILNMKIGKKESE